MRGHTPRQKANKPMPECEAILKSQENHKLLCFILEFDHFQGKLCEGGLRLSSWSQVGTGQKCVKEVQ